MLENLPRSYEAVQDWKWSQYEPFFQELFNTDITPANLDEWMQAYTRLAELIKETESRVQVAHNCDTEDKLAEQRFYHYIEMIEPPAEEAGNKLKLKLLQSGLEPQQFDVPLQKIRTDVEIFRQENLELATEIQKLGSDYDKTVGAQTVKWDGKEVTLTQLSRVFQETDRDRREQAWRLTMNRWLQNRKTYNEIYGKLIELRQQMAENADFPDFRALRWKQLYRFDYTPQDAQAFRDAIKQVVVPAARRLYQKRQQRLGLESLRPWDLSVDPDNKPALRPFEQVEDLHGKAAAIFDKVDPQLGGHFRKMQSNGLLDLDNRKGKAPGGYCTDFAVIREPFIFMNAVGTHDDVQTLLHEGGHAFHVYEAATLPYIQQLDYPTEFAEVASMSMELLAAPYLTTANGGYYTDAEAARARIEHLEGIISFWPYMAVVDGFQDWVYTHISEAKDPANCDAKWSELWDRFMQGIDYSGLQGEKETGWHRKLHIFTYPMYYIEYGLAQLGAVQVWAKSLENQVQAVQNYRKALALGGTASLPELFKAAGANFAFDAATLEKAVDLAERTIHELETVAD